MDVKEGVIYRGSNTGLISKGSGTDDKFHYHEQNLTANLTPPYKDVPGFLLGFGENVDKVKPWKIGDVDKIQYNTDGEEKMIKIIFNENGIDALILRVPKRGEGRGNPSHQIAPIYHHLAWWKSFLSDGHPDKLDVNSGLKRELTASQVASATGRGARDIAGTMVTLGVWFRGGGASRGW